MSLTSEITTVKESVKPNKEMVSIGQKTEHDILVKQLQTNTDEHLMQARKASTNKHLMHSRCDTRKIVPAPAVAKEEDLDKGRGVTVVDWTIKLTVQDM